MPQSDDPLLPLVARIVIAQVEHNDTPGHALPGLIRDVYHALATAGANETAHLGQTGARGAIRREAPAGQTVFDDHLICLECGLHMKMLRRHLQTVHNSTPAQYLAKWQLPGDHPLVAPRYAMLRSSLAKASGLGTRPAPRGR